MRGVSVLFLPGKGRWKETMAGGAWGYALDFSFLFLLLNLLMAIGLALLFAPDSRQQAVIRLVMAMSLPAKALLLVALIYMATQLKCAEIQPFIYFQF